MSVCAYCGEEITAGQPTVPDPWGDAGDRMHIDCPVVGEDGQDLSLGMGDS